jgi:hypothetical protein
VLTIHGYDSLFNNPLSPNDDWKGNEISSSMYQKSLGTDARDGVHQLLSTMGIGWNAISPAMIESDILTIEKMKVLIMPMCVALPDNVVRKISDWVQTGGHLIADSMHAGIRSHTALLRFSFDSPSPTCFPMSNPVL